MIYGQDAIVPPKQQQPQFNTVQGGYYQQYQPAPQYYPQPQTTGWADPSYYMSSVGQPQIDMSLDGAWARLIQKLATSCASKDSQIFADVAAVVIQSFGANSQSNQALMQWAAVYSQNGLHQQQMQQQMQQQDQQQQAALQQQQQQQQQQAQSPIPQDIREPNLSDVAQIDLTLPPPTQASGPFVAGRLRR